MFYNLGDRNTIDTCSSDETILNIVKSHFCLLFSFEGGGDAAYRFEYQVSVEYQFPQFFTYTKEARSS